MASCYEVGVGEVEALPAGEVLKVRPARSTDQTITKAIRKPANIFIIYVPPSLVRCDLRYSKSISNVFEFNITRCCFSLVTFVILKT